MIRFRERSRAGDEAGATEVSTSEPAARHSPGLQAALSGLAGDHPGRVLDFGPSVAANISFYSRFARHIQIVDLLGELRSEADGIDSPATVESVLNRSLPSGVMPFDLVLIWDIINYLDRDQAVVLVARIHAACRPNARLLLMIFTGDEMPIEPQTFQIEAEDRISYRATARETRAPTPLQPAEVERLLAGFRIESSFILRHGVREFVAVRR